VGCRENDRTSIRIIVIDAAVRARSRGNEECLGDSGARIGARGEKIYRGVGNGVCEEADCSVAGGTSLYEHTPVIDTFDVSNPLMICRALLWRRGTGPRVKTRRSLLTNIWCVDC